MFIEQLIGILEWFLKDRVTLKKSNDAENSALHHMSELHFKTHSNSKQFFEMSIIIHNVAVVTVCFIKCSLSDHKKDTYCIKHAEMLSEKFHLSVIYEFWLMKH